MGDIEGVGRRKDQRLINPDRLEELETLAQEGRDMRAALLSLAPRHYEMMEIARSTTSGSYEWGFAKGWLEFESDLGDALLDIRKRREGDAQPAEDDELPF